MTTLTTSRQKPAQRRGDAAGPRRHAHPDHVNVHETERAASVAIGSALAAAGLSRRSMPGLLLAAVGGALVYRGATGSCPAYHAMGVDTAHMEKDLHVSEAFTIDKPADELYDRWRDLARLPEIMRHLKTVRVLDERRSHWVASAPSVAGGRVQWNAELTEDMPGRRIAWRSLPDSDVDTEGSVSFDQSPRGTVVRVQMRYAAPGGKLGGYAARLFGEGADHQVREDLRRFKRIMEVGEAITTQGQPRGRCTPAALRRG